MRLRQLRTFIAPTFLATLLPQCASIAIGADGGVPLATTREAVGAPRPLRPLPLWTVASPRPAFRWQLAPGTDGARIEFCRDRDCFGPYMSSEVQGTSFVPTADLPAGLSFWRLIGLAGTLGGATHSAPLAVVVGSHPKPRTPLDLNGDGAVDLVVSDRGSASSGPAVYVYFGQATGVSSVYDAVLRGPGDGFGAVLANAGDINGDGFSDLLVGSISPSGVEAPVYLYLGSVSGPDPMRPLTIERPDDAALFGSTMASIGDVNGDGLGDFVIGAQNTSGEAGTTYLYLGNRRPNFAAPTHTFVGRGGHFGASIVPGDFDGDGAGDVAFGSAYTGELRIYSQAEEPAVVITGMGSAFGFINAGGDFNGDGFDDLLVHASPYLFVYSGAAEGLTAATMPSSLTIGSRWAFTESLADMNGDGFDDVLVSSGYHAGSRDGLVPGGELPFDPSIVTQLAGIGDANGDGFSDIAVFEQPVEGLTLYFGSAAWPRSSTTQVIRPPAPDRGFPFAIARDR